MATAIAIKAYKKLNAPAEVSLCICICGEISYPLHYIHWSTAKLEWKLYLLVLAEEALAEICVICERCSVRLRHWVLISFIRCSYMVHWLYLLCWGSEWHGSWMFLECALLVSCVGIKSPRHHLVTPKILSPVCGCTVGHNISYFSNSRKAQLNREGSDLHWISCCTGTCSSGYSEFFICATAEG